MSTSWPADAGRGRAKRLQPPTVSARLRPAALLLMLVASAALAFDPQPVTRGKLAELLAETTTEAVTLYVDPSGNNNYSCVMPGAAGACATPQGAIDRLRSATGAGKVLRHPVTITLAAGSYSAGAYVDDLRFESGPSPSTPGSLTIQGTLKTFSPATGTASGTTTARTNGTAPTTWATITDSGQSWTTNDLRGQLLEITSGTGSGQFAQIASNTSTTITIAGVWDTNLAASGNGYAIRDWDTSITGNLSASYSNIQSTTPGTHSVAFLFGGALETHALESAIKLQKLKISSAVARGVTVLGGYVSFEQNHFETTTNAVQVFGKGAVHLRHNSGNAGFLLGTFNGAFSRFSYMRNNVWSAGAGLTGASGSFGTFRAESNYAGAMTTAGHRLSSCLDCAIRGDHYSAPVYCVRIGGFNLSQVTTGAYSIDGIVCDEWTAFAIAAQSGDGTVYVDRVGTASTGTNSGGQPLVALNGAWSLLWSAVTNISVGGATDFTLNSTCNGSGLNFTQTQLRAAAGKFVNSQCDGAIVREQ